MPTPNQAESGKVFSLESNIHEVERFFNFPFQSMEIEMFPLDHRVYKCTTHLIISQLFSTDSYADGEASLVQYAKTSQKRLNFVFFPILLKRYCLQKKYFHIEWASEDQNHRIIPL